MEINLPKLKRLVKDSGLTQKEVARILNINRATVSSKLNGNVRFKRRELSALGRELGMTVEEVAAGKKKPKREDLLWQQLEWARKEADLKQRRIDELKAQLAESKQTIETLKARVQKLEEND